MKTMTSTNYFECSPAERLALWRRQLSRGMTVHELREFYESKEYLDEKLSLVGWENMTPRERNMLVHRSRQFRQTAWDHAWQIASHKAEREEGTTDEQHQEIITMLAEQVCIDQAIIPPHWTAIVQCSRCGEVAMPKGTPPKVHTCRWCSTPYAEYLSMRKQ